MSKEVAKLTGDLETGRISRRTFVKTAAALGLSMPAISALLAACAPAETPTAGPGATPTGVSAASPTPKTGETLVVASSGTPLTLDTDLQPSPENEWLGSNVYTEGVRYKVVYPPEIAPWGMGDIYSTYDEGVEGFFFDSWDVSPDQQEITWHLKKGIKSFYGNELTAHDYYWSWQRSLEFARVENIYFARIVGAETIDHYEAVDDYTFRVQLDWPSAIYFKVRPMDFFNMVLDSEEVKKHATDSDPWASEWLTTNTAGFGPYHVDKITPNEECVLVANPNWQEPLYFEKVVWKAVPDVSTRLALLTGGEIDLTLGLSERENVQVEADPNLQVVRTESNIVPFIGPVFTYPPLDNITVRQALAYATPYDEIGEKAYFGHYKLRKSIIPSIYPGGHPEYWVYNYDLDKARELLAEAGHADGFDVELSYVQGDPRMEETAILVKSAWANIGVRATLKATPPAIYYEGKVAKPSPFQCIVDCAQWPYVADPIYCISAYWWSESAYNATNYQGAEVDKASDEGFRMPEGPEREELSRAAQEAGARDVVWIHLPDPGWVVAAKKDLKGFVWYPENYVRFYHLYREG